MSFNTTWYFQTQSQVIITLLTDERVYLQTHPGVDLRDRPLSGEQTRRVREAVGMERWQVARREVAQRLAAAIGTTVLYGDDGRALGAGPVTEAVVRAVMEAQYAEFAPQTPEPANGR